MMFKEPSLSSATRLPLMLFEIFASKYIWAGPWLYFTAEGMRIHTGQQWSDSK